MGPAIIVTAEPESICPGDSSTLIAYCTAQTFNWAPGLSLSSTTTSSTLAFPLVTTTYTVTADNNGCISTADITVVVEPLPQVDFTADVREGCQGLTVNFKDLTTPQAVSWLWNFGENSPFGNTSFFQDPTHYYLDAGSFDVSLSVVTSAGCRMKMLYPDYILIHPNPDAYFEVKPDVINEMDSLVFFHDQSIQADIWNWYFGEPFSSNNTSSIQNPTHTYSDTGTYYPVLIVFSNYGCSDTIVGKVIVRPNTTFYVPNAFTPNKDGINQVFRAYGEGIDSDRFELFIYDRWGRMVFITHNIETGWDGTYNGTNCSEGVYVWHISYYDALKHHHAEKGVVTLIR